MKLSDKLMIVVSIIFLAWTSAELYKHDLTEEVEVIHINSHMVTYKQLHEEVHRDAIPYQTKEDWERLNR